MRAPLIPLLEALRTARLLVVTPKFHNVKTTMVAVRRDAMLRVTTIVHHLAAMAWLILAKSVMAIVRRPAMTPSIVPRMS
jgi:hypothetical protein